MPPGIGHAPGMETDVHGDGDWLRRASKRRRYLVGVSGGADSVALLHLLSRAGFSKLVICHLNHRLRGREATADERFVGRLAARMDYPFEVRRVAVAELAKKSGESVETAARRARHEFFADCARRRRCPRLLLAHHADDQAETVLWNLLRGSRGARGMESSRRLMMAGRGIEVGRPLLGWRREALRAWLRAEGLSWREDASNATPCAIRNRLRHEVLPRLEEIGGRDAAAALARAAESTRELREIEDWAVTRAAAVDPRGRLHLPRLRSLPEALRRACVFRFLSDAGVADLDRATLDRALAMLDPDVGAGLSLPGGKSLRRRQGRMWVE